MCVRSMKSLCEYYVIQHTNQHISSSRECTAYMEYSYLRYEYYEFWLLSTPCTPIVQVLVLTVSW